MQARLSLGQGCRYGDIVLVYTGRLTLQKLSLWIYVLYGYKYLLVFVDTFSGWTEAFPTKHETAKMVTKKLLEEIFPRYGMPQVLGTDNGPAFVSQVSQLVAKLLGIEWKLHCAYRPQSSGQVERMNRTIKETLTKLTLAPGS